jgi:hypothetical protein
MHQNIHLHRRVLHGALVMLERSAVKVARCVLRGERSREAPDLPGDDKTNCLSERMTENRMPSQSGD